MEVLLDANVLCWLVLPDDSQHAVAREAVELLLRAGHGLAVIPHVEREFWSVATRPRDQNGLGLQAPEAEAQLAAFARISTLRPDTAAVHEIWRRLVSQYQVLGKKVHDAGVVAAMLASNVSSVLTFDLDDFRRYEQLITIYAPDQIVRGGVGPAM